MAQEQFFQAIYRDQRYGKTFPTEANDQQLYCRNRSKDFYDQNFGAKRSVLYVVGKFDEEAVKAAMPVH